MSDYDAAASASSSDAMQVTTDQPYDDDGEIREDQMDPPEYLNPPTEDLKRKISHSFTVVHGV